MADKDWSQYFNQNILDNDNKIENNNVEDTEEKNDIETEEKTNTFTLGVKDYKEFCNRLSGYLPDGNTKAVISYQCFNAFPNMKDIKDPQKEVIYNINNAVVEMAFDELNPELVLISIKFKNFSDPELRLFWARLQKWRTSLSKPIDNNEVPIFLLYLMERDSVGNLDANESYSILNAEIVNPLIAYITREVPTMEATDIINEKDEHMGGNVIKLLCSTQYVTFGIRDDIDTQMIKAEVERENEDSRYIDAAPEYKNSEEIF